MLCLFVLLSSVLMPAHHIQLVSEYFSDSTFKIVRHRPVERKASGSLMSIFIHYTSSLHVSAFILHGRFRAMLHTHNLRLFWFYAAVLSGPSRPTHDHDHFFIPCWSCDSNNSSISHNPHNRSSACNLYDLLMPTKQYTHHLSSSLSTTKGSAADLGEACGLWRDAWFGGGGGGLRHSFVPGWTLEQCIVESRIMEIWS